MSWMKIFILRKLKTFAVINVLMLCISHNSFGQAYNCGTCGYLNVNSITKTTSGPGCLVTVNVSITGNELSCINNNWSWSTIPTGSSGGVYVGYSNSVPFTIAVNAGPFYMPQACNTLGSSFLQFTTFTGQPCALISLPVVYQDIWLANKSVKWITTSEVNLKHFEIETSTDGIFWIKDGELTPQKMNPNGQSYNYTIKTNKLNYVRLKQVDLDGQFNYSEVLAYYNFDAKEIETYSKIAIPFNSRYLPTFYEINDQLTFHNLVTGSKILDLNVTEDAIEIDKTSFLKGQYLVSVKQNKTQTVKHVLLIVY